MGETRIDDVLHQVPERRIESVLIDDDNGLAVQAELTPGQDLDQFVERADAAGQDTEAIRAADHLRLPLVHRVHDQQLGQPIMLDLDLMQVFRDDPDDCPATFERTVGDPAHQAQTSSAVDDAPTGGGDQVAQSLCCFQIRRIGAVAGAAIDTDGGDG